MSDNIVKPHQYKMVDKEKVRMFLSNLARHLIQFRVDSDRICEVTFKFKDGGTFNVLHLNEGK